MPMPVSSNPSGAKGARAPGAPRVTASVFKGLAHANEFGTLLVFLAGLMNVCVILDALVREPSSDAPTAGRRASDAKGAAA